LLVRVARGVRVEKSKEIPPLVPDSSPGKSLYMCVHTVSMARLSALALLVVLLCATPALPSRPVVEGQKFRYLWLTESLD
jgi:hypothetical protein